MAKREKNTDVKSTDTSPEQPTLVGTLDVSDDDVSNLEPEGQAAAAAKLEAELELLRGQVSSLTNDLEVATRSAAQWKAEAELQARNAADSKDQLEKLKTRFDELANSVADKAQELANSMNNAAKSHVRFQGTLKDAAEQHFQKRESNWNALTVIYDTEA